MISSFSVAHMKTNHQALNVWVIFIQKYINFIPKEDTKC
jgi:hypothetical protein